MFDLPTALVLAEGADRWEHGGWWPLWLVLWLAVLGTLVWLVIRARRNGGDGRAKEILAERYARGEISLDEYRERLGHLG
jgi:putative membrane protein